MAQKSKPLFPRILEVLAGIFIAIPIVNFAWMWSGAPAYPGEGWGVLYYSLFVIPISCLVLAAITLAIRGAYYMGWRSTQDIDALRKEQRRREYENLKKEFGNE